MLNLTKEEKIVLLFLITCFITGILISYLKQGHLLGFITSENKSGQATVSENIERRMKQLKTVNINTASEEELTFLPGIGTSTAEKIILYRKEHGFFNSLNNLKAVKGIGDKKVEKLKEFVIF